MLLFTWTEGSDAAGPEVDLAALFDEHGAFLVRSVRRLVPTEADAEDVVQDVFLIANRKRDDLRADGNLRGWLYRCARNVVRHKRRSFARRENLASAMEHDPSSESPTRAADEDVQTSRDVARVRACVSELPMSLREPFVLFELEGLSGAEVAGLLGISENAVWVRLTRARARFKTSFERSLQREAGGRDATAQKVA